MEFLLLHMNKSKNMDRNKDMSGKCIQQILYDFYVEINNQPI